MTPTATVPPDVHVGSPSTAKRVLIACEFSGIVRNAFLDRGHDAWSCDLVPTSRPPYDRHIRGDVTKLLQERWDIVIAHPPCTYLCLSGVCWLKKEDGRMMKMIRAREFFLQCLNANATRVCVENPIPHGHTTLKVGIPSQRIQPWQFGHNESKKTCLWLRNLPKLVPTTPTRNTQPPDQVSHKMGPSKYRGYLRSITYQGIADAMADQWGSL